MVMIKTYVNEGFLFCFESIRFTLVESIDNKC